MTARDEFLEILSVLADMPLLTGNELPFAENRGTSEAATDTVTSYRQPVDDNCQGAGQ